MAFMWSPNGYVKTGICGLLVLVGLVQSGPMPQGITTSNDDPTLLSNPNLVIHYTSKENLDRLTTHLNLKENVSGDPLFWDTVFFHLWTPETTPDNPVKLMAHQLTADIAHQAGFKPERKTVIASHGWQSGADTFDPLAKTYLANPQLSEINVFTLDWSMLSHDPTYVVAASNVPALGDKVGEVLGKVLVKELGQDPKNIHTVGHSLGAHVAGHAARKIGEAGGKGKIARATGLDPAKPWFDLAGADARILITDADLVDIIHTNSGNMWDGALSFPEALGHVDFYPNGGEHQAGCVAPCSFACGLDDLIDMVHSCSHSRSVEVYQESAQADNNDNGSFQSYDCPGWESFNNHICTRDCSESQHCLHMGEQLVKEWPKSLPLGEDPISTEGFFLDTEGQSPFSKS